MLRFLLYDPLPNHPAHETNPERIGIRHLALKVDSCEEMSREFECTPSGFTVNVAYKNAKTARLVDSGIITDNEAEMDRRAKEAISAAINKNKVCSKPVAVYDRVNKKAYLEYSDGKRKAIQ